MDLFFNLLFHKYSKRGKYLIYIFVYMLYAVLTQWKWRTDYVLRLFPFVRRRLLDFFGISTIVHLSVVCLHFSHCKWLAFRVSDLSVKSPLDWDWKSVENWVFLSITPSTPILSTSQGFVALGNTSSSIKASRSLLLLPQHLNVRSLLFFYKYNFLGFKQEKMKYTTIYLQKNTSRLLMRYTNSN